MRINWKEGPSGRFRAVKPGIWDCELVVLYNVPMKFYYCIRLVGIGVFKHDSDIARSDRSNKAKVRHTLLSLLAAFGEETTCET